MHTKSEARDARVPAELIPAIQQIHIKFERAHWQFGWFPQNLCYSGLHPDEPGYETANHLKALEELKLAVGAATAQSFDDLLAQDTAPACFKAYFTLFSEGVARIVPVIFRDLVDVAGAHQQLLNARPLEWANLQAQRMIRSKQPAIEKWVKEVCEKQVFDRTDDPEEHVYWRKWRAPMLLFMKPSRSEPYEASRVWESANAKASLECLTFFSGHHVGQSIEWLKNAEGEANLEEAKRPQIVARGRERGGDESTGDLFSVSPDFRSVRFKGSEYALTRGQGQMIEVLWEAHQSGHPVVGKDRLLKSIENETSAVRDTWRGSALWRRLIVSPKKGAYQLDLQGK